MSEKKENKANTEKHLPGLHRHLQQSFVYYL